MYPGWLAGPRARRLRRYAFSLTFFGSIAVEAGREAAIRFFPRVMSATFSIPFYPLSTVHWIAMSSTQGFDRPTDVLVPGVLGFHDELYSGIRSMDVISVPSVLRFHDSLCTGIRPLYCVIPVSPSG